MEACVDSVQSAIHAENGGACRVELCANLCDGGTTPSYGMVSVVKKHVTIPVFVMIRPRGGDFCYSPSEMATMKEDIAALTDAGANGFVFGILTREGNVDAERCRELLGAVHPLPATFHRAIDMSSDILRSLDQITELGFQRVLTSGGCPTALEGVDVINTMVSQAGDKVVIVPGGGIKVDNLEQILMQTGAREFHGSARKTVDSTMLFRKNNICMGSQPDSEYTTKVTSADVVREMVAIAHSVWKYDLNFQ